MPPAPATGHTIDALPTPVPLVDLDRLADNLDRMAAYTTLHGLALRPHVKTHKAPRIAAEQLARGAVGLTCATTRELAVMADVADDLLLAYPPVGAARLEGLAAVAAATAVTVTVDDAVTLPALAAAARLAGRPLPVLVELDVGMRRVGVAVDAPERAVALARALGEHADLRYAGVLCYPGHIRQPTHAQDEALAAFGARLAAVTDALADAGLPPAVVSAGSTPLAWRMHEVGGVTEVRPGTYVYNDRTTAAIGACDLDACALTVLATVVSTAVPGQAVVDAGTKALGREPVRDGGAGADASTAGWAAVLDHPEVVVTRMSEEHGVLDLGASRWRPRVGERVRLVPNHVCIVTHLFDEVAGVRDDRVETVWPVAARGREPLGASLEPAPAGPRAV